MNKFAQVLDILKKAAFGPGGEGSRGGHVIGHTRSGKPIYESSSHETHAAFSAQEHRDAMNHHHEIWSKTQDRITEIRKQRPNWNPPKQIHDFLKHHYTAMQMHQSRAGNKEGMEARQAKNLAAPAPIKSKPYNTPQNVHKSQEITPFYAAVIVVDNEGKNFLLGKRKDDGIWTSPAGGAKVGEKPMQAAIRECYEEANIILDPRQLCELPMGYAHNYKPVHCYIVRLSPEQMAKISVVNDPDKEVKQWKWHSIDGKMPEPMDNNRFCTLLNAKMHLAGIIMKSYYNMDVTEGMTQVNPAEVKSVNSDPHPIQSFIEERMASYQPGDTPTGMGLPDGSNLFLVRIDDGIYSGFVKRSENGMEETVASIDKMTIPDMVQFLRAKQIIRDATPIQVPPEKPMTAEEVGRAYASEMDRLAGEIAAQERDAQEKADLYRLFPEPQTRGQEIMLRLLVDKLWNESRIIRKAKALPVGTVRQWGVYKYVKHSDGWVVMGGEHHGKLMGDFKSQPKYADYARHHEKTSAKQDEPKESPKAPKEDAKPEPAKPTPEAPKEVPSDRDSDIKKLAESIKQSPEETKPDPEVEKHKAQEEYRQKNAKLIENAQRSGAHTMGLEAYMEHARGKRRAELIEQNKARHGEETESRVDQHMQSRKASYTKDFKAEHRRYTDAAFRSGMEVHPDAMREYPGMGGTSLPEEIDSELNKKTNMVHALDLGKTPKAVQKQFATHLNNCNKLVDSMGVKFKTPMTFKATGLTKLGKRTRGTYSDRTNTIELKDMTAAPKTLMHEIGHAIDYSLNEKGSPFKGRHSEMITGGKAAERQGQEPNELQKMFGELHDVVTQSDYYQQAQKRDRSHFKYLVTPTEVFARAFEVYALHKAEQMGMPPEFMETFVPDVFKLRDEKIDSIRQELDGIVKQMARQRENTEEQNKRYTQLREEMNQRIEKTDGGWVRIPEEKQMEYKTKVSELMEKILAQDPIKKAMQELDLLGSLMNLEKAQSLPVGSVRIWHGTKFIKQGDGHWVPMPAGQQAGQAQGNAAVQISPNAQPAPAAAQANLESQKDPKQEGEGKLKLAHPTEHLKPKKGFGGHVEIHSKDLDHQLKNGPISIISAGRNPNHAEDRGLSDEHVNERYKRLEQDLKDHGYKYTKVKGKYGAEEDSYMVHHADEEHMNELGRKYNQDSVIHSNEGKNKLHFTTGEHAGKHHKGEGHEELPDAQDYYSEIKTADGQKKKFSLGLDFGKHHEADAEPKKAS